MEKQRESTMTNKEAIRILKNIKEDNYNYVITGAMEVAIKAVKKQIPKKLEYVAIENEGHNICCMLCGEEIYRISKFCPECGQAIDWER